MLRTTCMELLTSESDGWTTLARPLLQFGARREEVSEGEAAERAAMADHLFAVTDGRLDSRTLRVLRESYRRLAATRAYRGILNPDNSGRVRLR